MIDKYIEYISKSRKELDGHAICPYAKKFADSVWIWKTDDMEERVNYYVNNFPVNKKVVVLIADPKKYSYKVIQELCDKYQTEELWLAPDHPEHYNEIGGVRTNNEDYAMILIQDREEIKKYSDILKGTSYYDFWSKEYYKEIVENR
jgi:hypothetical protein